MPVELITTEDAGRRLGVSGRTARRWCETGKIAARKLGENGHWRVEWDTNIMGTAIIAPVNEFIKTSCIRHGGMTVSRIHWGERGSVGRELKITVQGMNKKDCIAALRKISGGMTVDEMMQIGVCVSCVGYRWDTDSERPLRRTVHGQRDELNREDERETIKLLRRIERRLRDRQNPFPGTIYPIIPTDIDPIPTSVGGTPYYWDASTTGIDATPRYTVTATAGDDLTVTGYVSGSAWNPSGSTPEGQEVSVIAGGMVFLPMDTEELTVGESIDAEAIAERTLNHTEDTDGAYVQITDGGFRIHGFHQEDRGRVIEDDNIIQMDEEEELEDIIIPLTPVDRTRRDSTRDVATIMDRFPQTQWQTRILAYLQNAVPQPVALEGDQGEEFQRQLDRRTTSQRRARRIQGISRDPRDEPSTDEQR